MTECFDIAHDSDVGAIRRRFATLAGDAGLGETRVADAAIVASELASNVLKHAQRGGALLGARTGAATIVAWDNGPGMNVDACMQDGMSTAGSLGTGLGAIARLATRWDAFAPHGHGSILAVDIGDEPAPRFEVACVRLPYPGLTVCGDAWDVHVAGAVATIIVVDGLGHGDEAARASARVIDAFRAKPTDSVCAILDHGHHAARSTRGAAATCVRVDLDRGTATIAGVGNVAAWIVAGKSRQLVTQHGTLGHVMPRLREESYPFPAGAQLVVCSDGLKSRLPLDESAGLLAHRPMTIAAALWRDHNRGRDDATVAVLRGAR